MIELPGNLKDILVCEDVSLSFKENRYYVTERQEIIAKNIFRLAKVSGKLMELMIPYKMQLYSMDRLGQVKQCLEST